MPVNLLSSCLPKDESVALIVQKYGGTSVGTIERIHRIPEIDAQASKAPVREANQFIFKLFVKG